MRQTLVKENLSYYMSVQIISSYFKSYVFKSLRITLYLVGINSSRYQFSRFSRFFDKVAILFWKILSFLGNFGDFCSFSMVNPRKYIPAKHGHFYHNENKYPRKLIPIRHHTNHIRLLYANNSWVHLRTVLFRST